MSRLKTWLWQRPALSRLLRFATRREARVQWRLRRLLHDPPRHCRYLIAHSTLHGFGTTFPRTLTVDLAHPARFDEKVLWLKYYRYDRDPLVARCYDKYAVRGYVEERGGADALNELLGVWDSLADVPWNALPDDCVLKVTNGCGEHVFKRKGELFDAEAARARLRRAMDAGRLELLASGGRFAATMPQRIVCERLLTSDLGHATPEDYKFYCFHGEPRYLLLIWDRYGEKPYRAAFRDIGFADRGDLFFEPDPYPLQRPACYDAMVDLCRKLAAPFPFVRVDLYEQDGKPVFGELTFAPIGGHMLYHVFKADGTLNEPALREMGDWLRIDA